VTGRRRQAARRGAGALEGAQARTALALITYREDIVAAVGSQMRGAADFVTHAPGVVFAHCW
jgi:FixJ family two-component response regulator